jgi:adenylosuccinate synthase
MPLPATVVVGLQWGDEGKAKILDELAAEADIVCRFQGGSNAGHTVVVDGEKYKFHLVPCGIAHPAKRCVISNGVVVDPVALLDEIRHLESRGLDVRGRLVVSDRAHVVLAHHKRLEAVQERSRGTDAIGTTLRGIGPAYSDKAARVGIRMGDLLRPDRFRAAVERRLRDVNAFLASIPGEKPLTVEEVVEPALDAFEELRPMVADTFEVLNDALDEGRNVLFEGAQGTLLDVDFGTYPFVTSSNSSAMGLAAGSGVSPWRVTQVLGVLKAYCTRVGAGPFPTEEKGRTGERLREAGGEYGTTTGRPRRCGWFDAVAGRYAVRLNSVSEAVVSKLDVLTGEPVVKIAIAYRLRDGRTIRHFPADVSDLEGAEPIYEEHEGWTESISSAKFLSDLPGPARRYLARLVELTGARVSMVSVGEGRGETVRCPAT